MVIDALGIRTLPSSAVCALFSSVVCHSATSGIENSWAGYTTTGQQPNYWYCTINMVCERHKLLSHVLWSREMLHAFCIKTYARESFSLPVLHAHNWMQWYKVLAESIAIKIPHCSLLRYSSSVRIGPFRCVVCTTAWETLLKTSARESFSLPVIYLYNWMRWHKVWLNQ